MSADSKPHSGLSDTDRVRLALSDHPASDAFERLLEQYEEMHERWLGMRDCYDREVLASGRLKEQLETVQRERDEWAREFKRVQDIGFANAAETAALINAEMEEQLEKLDSALRDILDITEGWTPKMDLEVRLKRIDAYAKEALKANSNPATPEKSDGDLRESTKNLTSNPASGPKP